jgi:hypothetical protein
MEMEIIVVDSTAFQLDSMRALTLLVLLGNTVVGGVLRKPVLFPPNQTCAMVHGSAFWATALTVLRGKVTLSMLVCLFVASKIKPKNTRVLIISYQNPLCLNTIDFLYFLDNYTANLKGILLDNYLVMEKSI